MSYDVYLTADLGGPERVEVPCEHFNVTWNLTPMLMEAGELFWPDLAGKTAGEALVVLEKTLAALLADPARFQAMNPANGWGTYAGIVEKLPKLIESFRQAPKAIVGVS